MWLFSFLGQLLLLRRKENCWRTAQIVSVKTVRISPLTRGKIICQYLYQGLSWINFFTRILLFDKKLCLFLSKWFFTALDWYQMQFCPIGQKKLILHENLEFLMAREKFPLKKGNFWPMGQKDGDFLFWSTLEPMVTFLGLKNQTSP